MLVCHCHSVNCHRIREEARAGARTVGQIGRKTGAGTSCGGCVPAIRDVLETSRRLPVLSASGVIETSIAAE